MYNHKMAMILDTSNHMKFLIHGAFRNRLNFLNILFQKNDDYGECPKQ